MIRRAGARRIRSREAVRLGVGDSNSSSGRVAVVEEEGEACRISVVLVVVARNSNFQEGFRFHERGSLMVFGRHLRTVLYSYVGRAVSFAL